MFAKTAFAAFAAAVALSFAAGAHAAPANTDDNVSVKVNTADLDLNSHAGAKTALVRIRLAATEICGQKPSIQDLDGHAKYKACMKTTIDHAVAPLNNPVLTAMAGGAQPSKAGDTVLAQR